MPNARDYKGDRKKLLIYGPTGSGKTEGILTFPGKKFVYVLDPAGLETLAGHDVEYELFTPKEHTKLKKNTIITAGGKTKGITSFRPDPDLYAAFEDDLDKRLTDDFFSEYDLVAIDSITMLLEMVMAHIMNAQGKIGQPPELQDYFLRSDGLANLIKALVSKDLIVYITAHSEVLQDEVTRRIEEQIALPAKLKRLLPIQFSDVIFTYTETDSKGRPNWFGQFFPDRRHPNVRTSLKNVKQVENITVDHKKPIEGQGLYGVFSRG